MDDLDSKLKELDLKLKELIDHIKSQYRLTIFDTIAYIKSYNIDEIINKKFDKNLVEYISNFKDKDINLEQCIKRLNVSKY